MLDAVVVGAGPNGLAAALTLAQKGLKVLVLEGGSTPGGGMRTLELTLPGFRHDVCSAIHPMGLASPYFQGLPLAKFGLRWIHPTVPLGHALTPQHAVILERSLAATADRLGRDGRAYDDLMDPLVHGWPHIDRELLGPLSIPRRPWELSMFGLKALLPARTLLDWTFRGPEAKALLAGICAHSVLPLEWPPSAAPGLVLGAVGHRFGWPMAEGGSQSISTALVGLLESLGGEVVCNHTVRSLDDLPPSRLVLLDVTPSQFLALAGERLKGFYRKQLEAFRHGPGAFKVDYALSDPIPWINRELAGAGTVHLGGDLAEMCASESAVWRGQNVDRPYVLVAQQTLFDPSRAPGGKHTAWVYCHVPAGNSEDRTAAVEGQLERFAPGFRDCVLARHVHTSASLEAYNPNYVGGDIGGGALLLHQLFTRPVLRLNPYSTPLQGVYLCSSSTPPGGGVHGMCGHHAALSAFRKFFA